MILIYYFDILEPTCLFFVIICIQVAREISAIIVTDDCLCYKEPKSPYNSFLILILNELFKFKTLYEWQHSKTGSSTM